MITGVIVDTENVLTTDIAITNTLTTGDTGTSIAVIGDHGMTGTTTQNSIHGYTSMADIIGKGGI
jgi:hypothetical protein